MTFFIAASLMLLILITKINSLDLNCVFKSDETWFFVPGEGCSAKDALINTPDQIVTSVNGKSESAYHDQVVNFLSFFGNQTVNYIPKGIEKFFPNLQGIEIFNAQLQTLEKSDLKPFRKLKELWLNNNNLETLASDLFEFNPELLFVNFGYNKLKFIGAEILNPLKELEMAHFNYNICIDSDGTTLETIALLMEEIESKCALEN